ncbi:universal stress protein [Gordonia sp. ABSL1-1]|uniref:universal stress protein n=1 Tax=Gordonia sp. ABSL1-1 TaxID=3053923 RepID=UPI002572CFF8|nr:universal stress protein [Gordonia sp. ABSL1-1]MDL9938828.1 universal stress protein [Gordonia sp. ABSL1-1]
MFLRNPFGDEPATAGPITADIPTGRLIVGFDDTDTSRRILNAIPHLAEAGGGVILATATSTPRPPGTRTGPPRAGSPWSSVTGRAALATALHDDAYLLSDRAITDELLRRGREAMPAGYHGQVDSIARVGNPLRVLRRLATDTEATAVLVGMTGDRPGPLARRLARTLPSSVSLIVTDGRRLIRPATRAAASSSFPGLRVAHPQPAG